MRRQSLRTGSPMRARSILSFAVLLTACARGTDVSGPQGEQPQPVLAPARPSFIVAPVTAPAGLAACWNAEGNANDIANGNNGTIAGSVSFAPGKFGQAFSFDNVGGDVHIPAS